MKTDYFLSLKSIKKRKALGTFDLKTKSLKKLPMILHNLGIDFNFVQKTNF